MSSTTPHFVDPGLAEHALTMAFGRNFRDTSPRCESLTLEALAQLFHRPDTGRSKLTFSAYHALEKKDQRAAKDGEYFMPVTFARNGTRSGEAISTIGAFVIDIDTGAISKNSLVDALYGLPYIGYSSFSHSADMPKWRAIIPFNTRPAQV